MKYMKTLAVIALISCNHLLFSHEQNNENKETPIDLNDFKKMHTHVHLSILFSQQLQNLEEKSAEFFNNITSIDQFIERSKNFEEFLLTSGNAFIKLLKEDQRYQSENDRSANKKIHEEITLLAQTFNTVLNSYKQEILATVYAQCIKKFSEQDCKKFHEFSNQKITQLQELLNNL